MVVVVVVVGGDDASRPPSPVLFEQRPLCKIPFFIFSKFSFHNGYRLALVTVSRLMNPHGPVRFTYTEKGIIAWHWLPFFTR